MLENITFDFKAFMSLSTHKFNYGYLLKKRKTMKSKIIIILFTIAFSKAFSQAKEMEIQSKTKNGSAKFIKFKQTIVADDSQAINKFLKSQYRSSPDIDFKIKKKENIDNLGFKSTKLQQWYNGLKVEFAIFNVLSKDGRLKSINGNFIEIKDLSTTPILKEDEALKKTLNYINAKKYIWQDLENENNLKETLNDPNSTNYPNGELLIISRDHYNKSVPTLAYKFDIYSIDPLSRANYYVDASNGNIILVDAIIKHVEGIAATRYSGQRNIETTFSPFGNNHILLDMTRGNGIHTQDMEGNGNNYNSADNLNDNDNNWTNAEYNNTNHDNALLDAHWGAIMTYDYFSDTHGRNSIDDNGFRLRNFVNANLTAFGRPNDDNAFWDGEKMTYGVGTNFGPLVSIDIVAHEIGHGLDQFTSDLVYQNESGAIDESLSDIWGAMVEFYAAPEKDAYLLGEDIVPTAIRSLSSPKVFGDPDTYLGDNWWTTSGDNGGVHTNSGVMNHWFYLLAEGSGETDGINDNGDIFDIQGIGKLNASQILYRAQTVYFTPNTTYSEARNHTIQAAEDIFGANSIEVITTNNAWYAVGIGDLIVGQLEGDDCVCYNPTTTLTFSNFANQPVSWQTSSNIQILNSSNTSITIRAINSSTRGTGFVTANVGDEQMSKDIWVGKPNAPTSLHGPTSVRYGAIVRYTGSSVQGASSYKWYLPRPYDQNASVTVDPPRWGILSGGTSRYLRAIVGPNNGLVQFMGENKCGRGGAKWIHVSNSSTTGGGTSPGGGNMPISTFGNTDNVQEFLVYPNPVKTKLNIIYSSSSFSNLVLYDLNGKEVLRKNINNGKGILDVSKLSNGLYFIQINGEINTVKKIIVE